MPAVEYTQHECKTDDNGWFLLITIVGLKADECAAHLFEVLSGESLDVISDNRAQVVFRPSPETSSLHALEAAAFNAAARWSAANA